MLAKISTLVPLPSLSSLMVSVKCNKGEQVWHWCRFRVLVVIKGSVVYFKPKQLMDRHSWPVMMRRAAR